MHTKGKGGVGLSTAWPGRGKRLVEHTCDAIHWGAAVSAGKKWKTIGGTNIGGTRFKHRC